MRSRCIVAAAAAAALLSSGPAQAAAEGDALPRWWQDDPVREHVVSVLTRSEYGDRRRRVVRWVTSPRLAIIGGTAAEQALARAVAAELSAALSAASGLEIVEVSDPEEADMRLFLGPRPALEAAARQEGFSYITGNNAMFWASWNRRGEIWRATILVSTDASRSVSRTRHLLLEEMTQALGMMNDSPRFPESVFFETSAAYGTAETLGRLDRKTVALLYAHLPTNARPCRVRRAYRRHWAGLSGD